MADKTAESGGGILGDLNLDYAEHESVLQKAVSADGTLIAYEQFGETGPAVVVVGAGLNDRAMFTPLATAMSERFRVFNYDRRGRGESGNGDPDQWTIQLEIDDLRAVLEAVGEPCHVFANCTGGVIALLAAAGGAPMVKLALYEPPYWSETATAEQVAKLKQLIAEDRREEVVTIFARDVVGFIKDENIEHFKSHPAWKAFESMAPSTYYDAMISKDHLDIPYEEIRKITVPTLLMRGDDGIKEIHDACARIAEEIPRGELLTREGFDHLFDQKAWAPTLMEYFEA
ncbi:alpha/beta fold hydrolase [Amycolatopsis thailandensis]|uniref:Alpha/beta hydrolase n=1 Tax=Amycolatopsis thailandensis TaxID=589330 RepID=A0A229S338_9PSEU|nr:alpha/beta hydrolase [Amycolatopsis thailandensis]OXM53129.1 alpha/beta hydrolase [Amycolatopsis thailandensis]